MMTDFRPERAAARLLAQQSAIGHGAWVRELRFDRKILFDTFAHYGQVCGRPLPVADDGCTVLCHGVSLILYNPGWQTDRINYTLAHEVGHILLGHTQGSAQEERQANRFASALLVPHAPLAALRRAGVGDTRALMRFFGTSRAATEAALARTPFACEYDRAVLALYDRRIRDFLRSREQKHNLLDISCDL